MDKIHIRDLRLTAIIGTFPEERVKKQEIIFNISISCDLSKAGKSDSLVDTVDYKTMKQSILAHVENSQYFLIESLAESVAALCLNTEGVEEVTVTVDKPGALRFARSVAVEITRSKDK